MHPLFVLICGMLFGIGLSLSGMTDPQVVLDFLDLFGDWNPSLLVVMATAVPTVFIGYRMIIRRERPLYGNQFHWPTSVVIDRKLVVGAILFGIGWGLLGLCPGPAVASLLSFQPKVFLFVLFMIIGMLSVRVVTTLSRSEYRGFNK